MKNVVIIERSELAELQHGGTISWPAADGQVILIALERPKAGNGNGSENGQRRHRRKSRQKLQAKALATLARAKRPMKLGDLKASLGLKDASRYEQNALEKVMIRLANNGTVKRTGPGTYALRRA